MELDSFYLCFVIRRLGSVMCLGVMAGAYILTLFSVSFFLSLSLCVVFFLYAYMQYIASAIAFPQLC